MSELPVGRPHRGYWAVGVYHPKAGVNIGTLFRSAAAFGADFIFTVGRRYDRQASDTTKAWRHMPLFHFTDIDDLVSALPYSCPLVGVELDEKAVRLTDYEHHERAVYLLGAEDYGLPPEMIERCHEIVQIPGPSHCLNVAVAGSIVMYDRFTKYVRLRA